VPMLGDRLPPQFGNRITLFSVNQHLLLNKKGDPGFSQALPVYNYDSNVDDGPDVTAQLKVVQKSVVLNAQSMQLPKRSRLLLLVNSTRVLLVS
jgi:hypothetical protein